MIDKEKVIQGFESCWVKEPGILNCQECPYKEHLGKGRLQSCTDRLHIDALDLLKEQEDEIRQLKLALDIVKGTSRRIKIEGR